MDKGVPLQDRGAGMLGRERQQISMSYSNTENTCYKVLSKNNKIKVVATPWLGSSVG